MPPSPKRPTSNCCCIGVRCKCPKRKVCPSLKRDVNAIRKYVQKNNLTNEEELKYISSLRKKKSARKSMRKSRKSTRKSMRKKKSVRKTRKSVRK